MKIFLNIYFIIFQSSVGSWQSIAAVEKVQLIARRKKEKREALIKHSSLGIQRYIGKISSLSDEIKIVSTYVRKENPQLIKR